jgi:peptidoglycan/xylan/chitin deacetylase (PgdA/CDA1 family)
VRAWAPPAALGLAAVLGHAVPAAAWLTTLRPQLAPGLTGLGATDRLALTFDDGPDPRHTPAFLAELDRFGWRATFFVLGQQVRRHPSLVAEIAAAGHELAVHGEDHRDPLRRFGPALAGELGRVRDTLTGIAGESPRWYRPAYGRLAGSALAAARTAGLRPVLWSAAGHDWGPAATGPAVLARLTRGRLVGGTVLLHDSAVAGARPDAALAALPLLAEQLADAHVAVVPLAEHLI